jgi:CHAT domain-containing protein/predicted negative regulator of RcsB-dependent stress response
MNRPLALFALLVTLTARAWPQDAASAADRIARGDSAFQKGGNQQALLRYKEAERLARASGEKQLTASALKKQGDVYLLLGDYASAHTVLGSGLALAEETNDGKQIAEIVNVIANVYWAQDERAKALEYALRAMSLRRELNDRSGVGSSLNNLGNMARSAGDLERAVDYLTEALEVFKELEDERRRSVVLFNLAIVYGRLGEYRRALGLGHESLEIAETRNDEGGVATACDRLGEIYLLQGNYKKSLQLYERALRLRRKADFKWGMAETLYNIGLVDSAMGQYELSERHYRQALQLNRELGDHHLTGLALSSLGLLMLQRGRAGEALSLFEQARQLGRKRGYKSMEADALDGIGDALRLLGRHREADERLRESLGQRQSIGEKEGMAKTLAALAMLELDRKNYPESTGLAEHAASIANSIESPEIEWNALTIQGRALQASHAIAEASRCFDRAIQIVESLRHEVGGIETRIRFFAGKLDPYRERMAIALASADWDKAFEIADQSKARALSESMYSPERNNPGLSAEERQTEQKLRGRLVSLDGRIRVALGTNAHASGLAALQTERSAARLEYEALRSSVLAESPDDRDAPRRIEASTARAFSAQSGALILEYAITPRIAGVFAITASRVKWFPLGTPQSAVKKLVREYRERIATRDLRLPETARQLYSALLAPLADLLRERSELIVIPDSYLWDVPFHALRSSSGRWVLEEIPVSYAYSVAALDPGRRRTASKPASSRTLLAFGDPVPSEGHDLPPLPLAAEQVQRLASLYGPSRSFVRTGAAADEASFKREAPNYSVLHFAAHGVLDASAPLYSHLVLSPSPGGDDGLLEAWEIMDLRLNADLVILSACETAGGRVSQGEGMIGLAWAFLVAGSRSLIASEWKAESASSTQLMVDFHGYWTGSRSKSAALREAALHLLRDPRYQHPFYWASHILIGDSR